MPDEVEQAYDKKYRALKFCTTWTIALLVPAIFTGMFFMDMPYANPAMWLLSTSIVFWLGRGLFTSIWKQLKYGSVNMDTLVANSIGIAYLFSLFNMFFLEFWLERGTHPHVYFETASVIIAFILLGRLLGEKVKRNTSSTIRKPIGLQSKIVTVITGPSPERTVPIEQIRPGDIILVKPGERTVVDGIVTEGSSYVDESTLSGEPVAIAKQKDAKVFAGTVNQKGNPRFSAKKVGTDILLAKIAHVVQDAQGSKAPVQQLVDRIVVIFVLAIIGIAVLSFIAWILLDGQNGLTHGLLALVTVLIIAYPCALGLATPTVIIVGIGKDAEEDILIKDAEGLKITKKIDMVVLDKTGAVTEGKPMVGGWIQVAQAADTEDTFYSLERLSEHPLAEAVVRHSRSARTVKIDSFESIIGRDVRDGRNGKTYYVGNRKLLEEYRTNISQSLCESTARLTADTQTAIWFAGHEKALAIAGITDRIKPTSIQATGELQSADIEVYMLMDDNEVTAQEIAHKAGILHYKTGVLPREKAAFIGNSQKNGKKAAMVGDGINNSAALAQADLSIAMGGGGDIVMDVTKMTITSPDLTKIPEALKLSKLTVRTIRQNLFWALICNIIGALVATGVLYPVNGFLLNPMIAGTAMTFSSVSVVTNSLRLKRRRIEVAESPAIGNAAEPDNEVKPLTKKVMKKEFKVEGMMCNHCRMRVEEALNGMGGVRATVSLNSPVATVELLEGRKTLDELQAAISVEAGDYMLRE